MTSMGHGAVFFLYIVFVIIPIAIISLILILWGIFRHKKEKELHPSVRKTNRLVKFGIILLAIDFILLILLCYAMNFPSLVTYI